MIVALVTMFLGYTLIYAAVHKEAPWDEIIKAFGGQPQGLKLTSFDTGTGTPPSGTPPPTGTVSGGIALTAGMTYIGCPYVFGGSACSPGIDCSGLTMKAWAAAGITLPHHAASQRSLAESNGWMVDFEAALNMKGALLFYVTDGSIAEPGHVALSMGDGKNMLTSNHPGDGPHVESAWTTGRDGAAMPGQNTGLV